MDELKTQYGTQGVDYYSKLELIDKEFYFIKFEKVLRRKKEDYENQESKDNIDKIKKEILDVTQIVTDNISLLLDRDQIMNCKNLFLMESIQLLWD